MKIFQVISSLGNGGAEKLVIELSNKLASNHDVTVLSIKKIEESMFFAKKINKKVKLIQFNKNKGLDLKVLYNLFEILKKEKPDIVHVHLTMPLKYIILLIPFFRDIHFIHTIHNTFEPHQKLFLRLNLLPFYRRVMNICLSKSIYDKFSLAFPKLQFSMIENGIIEMEKSSFAENVKKDIEIIKGNTTSNVFLCIGRLGFQKNTPLLLEVFRATKLKMTKLIIIGDGSPEITEQVQKVSQLSKNQIVFLGIKENVADYMKYCDALILTSRFEGMPIVILEALSEGLPILSTPVGGIPDMITDGVNGFLSTSTEKDDIVDIIDKFCRLDSIKIMRIREANIRLFNEKYSIRVCAGKHEALYFN